MNADYERVRRMIAAVGWWIVTPAKRQASPDHWRNRLGGRIVHFAANLGAQNDSSPACSEGDHPNDDNPGKPTCKTCEDWT